MAFGSELKRLRGSSKVSALAIAKAMGVGVERLRKWEQNDTDPKAQDQTAIELFFKMPLEEIGKLKKIPQHLIQTIIEAADAEDDTQAKEIEYTVNPMLRRRTMPNGDHVKYYDTDFSAGSVNFYEDNVAAPAYNMHIPAFNGCVAFNVFGDSMEPRIKSGSVVFARKIEDWQTFVEFGQIYGIVLKDGRRMLKYIHASLKMDHFQIRSENPEHGPQDFPMKLIHNIWLIEGWMLKKV